MAITLQLTDGTDTFDFNDGTTATLIKPTRFNVGTDRQDVGEVFTFAFVSGVTTDQIATALQKMQGLIWKAERHGREQLINQAVWLVAKGDAETNTRYAKIRTGAYYEMPSRIYYNQQSTFRVTFTREGAWRTTAPDGTAGTTVVNGTTIYNKSDADGDNWVTVSERANDAPSLLEVTVNPSNFLTGVLIAHRTGTTAFLNEFNPWFNATDQSSAHSETSDGSAPGDFKIALTSDNTITWAIAAGNIDAYTGTFDVYAYSKIVSGTGSATGRFLVTDGSSLTIHRGPAVDLDRMTGLAYLGQVTLPGTVFNPFGSADEGITIALEIDITGTATVDTYALGLVPIELPTLFYDSSIIWGSSADNMIADGVNEIVYPVDSTSGNWSSHGGVSVQGVYPMLLPDTENRFYFFAFYNIVQTDTAQAGAASTITLSATASSTDDYYNGATVRIVHNTGVTQVRQITDYVGSTKVATVDRAWSTQPDSTSQYNIEKARLALFNDSYDITIKAVDRYTTLRGSA